MGCTSKLIVFELSDKRFALDISTVEQVVQIAEINSLPEMPDYIPGVINFHGDIIPVVDLNFLFNRCQKDIDLSDQLIVIKTSSLRCALWVNTTIGLVDTINSEIKDVNDIYEGIPYVKGMLKDDAGILLISDTEKFFEAKELEKINKLLEESNEFVEGNIELYG